MLYIAFYLLGSFIIPMDFVLLLRDAKIWSRNVATQRTSEQSDLIYVFAEAK